MAAMKQTSSQYQKQRQQVQRSNQKLQKQGRTTLAKSAALALAAFFVPTLAKRAGEAARSGARATAMGKRTQIQARRIDAHNKDLDQYANMDEGMNPQIARMISRKEKVLQKDIAELSSLERQQKQETKKAKNSVGLFGILFGQFKIFAAVFLVLLFVVFLIILSFGSFGSDFGSGPKGTEALNLVDSVEKKTPVVATLNNKEVAASVDEILATYSDGDLSELSRFDLVVVVRRLFPVVERSVHQESSATEKNISFKIISAVTATLIERGVVEGLAVEVVREVAKENKMVVAERNSDVLDQANDYLQSALEKEFYSLESVTLSSDVVSFDSEDDADMEVIVHYKDSKKRSLYAVRSFVLEKGNNELDFSSIEGELVSYVQRSFTVREFDFSSLNLEGKILQGDSVHSRKGEFVLEYESLKENLYRFNLSDPQALFDSSSSTLQLQWYNTDEVLAWPDYHGLSVYRAITFAKKGNGYVTNHLPKDQMMRFLAGMGLKEGGDFPGAYFSLKTLDGKSNPVLLQVK